ncbi:hypothetical protein KCU65_g470, partial [Aureobasidium melanogenum]
MVINLNKKNYGLQQWSSTKSFVVISTLLLTISTLLTMSLLSLLFNVILLWNISCKLSRLEATCLNNDSCRQIFFDQWRNLSHENGDLPIQYFFIVRVLFKVMVYWDNSLLLKRQHLNTSVFFPSAQVWGGLKCSGLPVKIVDLTTSPWPAVKSSCLWNLDAPDSLLKINLVPTHTALAPSDIAAATDLPLYKPPPATSCTCLPGTDMMLDPDAVVYLERTRERSLTQQEYIILAEHMQYLRDQHMDMSLSHPEFECDLAFGSFSCSPAVM